MVWGLDLASRGDIDVLPPFLNFRMAWNQGVNFGLLSDDAEFMRWVLIAVALAISAWVWIWVSRENPSPRVQLLAGVLIGGALGNVVDRVLYGAVADFLNMSCCGIENPFAFNVADVAIFVGAIGLVLFTGKDKPARQEAGKDPVTRPSLCAKDGKNEVEGDRHAGWTERFGTRHSWRSWRLAACSGNQSLMNIKQQGNGPDEFAVLPVKPLEMPKSLAELPPPTPGGTNITDPTPDADAIIALGGRPGAPRAAVPASDGTLAGYAGRYGVTPDIRQQLALEDQEFRRREPGTSAGKALRPERLFQGLQETGARPVRRA